MTLHSGIADSIMYYNTMYIKLLLMKIGTVPSKILFISEMKWIVQRLVKYCKTRFMAVISRVNKELTLYYGHKSGLTSSQSQNKKGYIPITQITSLLKFYLYRTRITEPE